jgi:hypothetical protein
MTSKKLVWFTECSPSAAARNCYPHLIAAVVLVAVLVPPFLLTHGLNLEPYPAVLFPSGHSVIDLSSPLIQFGELTVAGRDPKTGDWITLDSASFIAPIPPWYFSPIIRRCIAVLANADDKDDKNTRFAPASGDAKRSWLRQMLRAAKAWVKDSWLYSWTSRPVTDADRDELREWIQRRLRTAGCDTDSLLIRSVIVSYDTRVHAVTSREEQDVWYIPLD